jgi:hypothetical protein
MEPVAVAQRIVAADGDQYVKAQICQVFEDMRRKILKINGLWAPIRFTEKFGGVAGFDLAGVGAGGM